MHLGQPGVSYQLCPTNPPVENNCQCWIKHLYIFLNASLSWQEVKQCSEKGPRDVSVELKWPCAWGAFSDFCEISVFADLQGVEIESKTLNPPMSGGVYHRISSNKAKLYRDLARLSVQEI